jgi:hypothetical protein
MTWSFQGATQGGLSIFPLRINNNHPNEAEVVKTL